MTWLGWLNYYILQWFFFRLAREYDNTDKPLNKFSIFFPIVPMSGWEDTWLSNKVKQFNCYVPQKI